jgi:hypothetical protein
MYFAGTTGDTNQPEATDQLVVLQAVKKGMYFDLGYVSITTIEVKDETDTTTYVEGTDYTIDRETGLLGIVNSGAILDDSALNVTLSASEYTGEAVEYLNATQVEMELKFIGCPSDGQKYETTIYKVKVAATGEVGLKGDEYIPIPFTGTALADTSKGSGLSQYGKVRTLPQS